METGSGHLDFIDIFIGSKRDKREEEKRLKEKCVSRDWRKEKG